MKILTDRVRTPAFIRRRGTFGVNCLVCTILLIYLFFAREVVMATEL